MAELIGGLRDRLILQSIHNNLQGHLTRLGWFTVGRNHSPIIMIDEFPNDDAEVALNTLAVSMGDGGGPTTELGSGSEDHEMVIFADFFAEGDSVGRHLRGDIYEYFRANDQQRVFDYSSDDSQFATVEVQEDVDKRKPDRAVTEWQKHWYTVSFTIIDYGRPHTPETVLIPGAVVGTAGIPTPVVTTP